MFKKFEGREAVTGSQQLKTSVQKAIRNGLMVMYPLLGPYLDGIVPKKDGVRLVKCREHVELLTGLSGDILFFKHRDGPYIPSLRLLHQYPFILVPQQVDKGAIKFVLSGAQIMCPGLTSPGAKLAEADKDTVVAIMAEGKTHALAVGQMKMSTQEIKDVNKGIGIENIHYLNDGLWALPTAK